jgi:UDPglucose--hexose-1-phosphate uridylyltransferase
VPTREGRGACEVVVFTQDPKASLGSLPLWHVELVLEVWGHRYAELGSRSDVQYVFPFENRGVEVGVTLSHPHGQIYAYPFIPPIPARELEQQLAYLAAHGTSLVGDLVDRERKEARRILYEGPHCAAFVPVVARYPYEVWLAPYSPYASFADVPSEVRRDLARALKLVLMKYDGLWQRPFPYILVVHQAPADGRPHPEAHVHVEIYPALRMRDRIKYLAGSEIGAGVFTADTNPDDKAAELQAVSITLD